MELITIKFVVGVGYLEGDYAVLYGNGGSGDIDWDTPLSAEVPLFPNRMGIYGWGFGPWGYFEWGYAYSTGPYGWGYLPWGYFPWGYGSEIIEAYAEANECGEYKFAFAAYDAAGNEHEGSPEELSVICHMAPQWPPAGLKKVSYSKDDYCYVSGECSPPCDGKYFEEGTYNGQPYYKREDGNRYLWWNGSDSWFITTSLGAFGTDWWQRIDSSPKGLYIAKGTAVGNATVSIERSGELILDVAA